jgi:phage tail protein X
VDANGERLSGTDLRLIPPTPGQFLHTVRDRDRLDLVAYKYYSDATRWWQICDANPQFEFPNDLLDTSPVAQEILTLVHPDVLARYTALLQALAVLGQVTAPNAGLPGDFVACSVIVVYSAAARTQIVNAIAQQMFHLLHSFAWPVPPATAESFTFEDPAVKTAWEALLRVLRQTPGIIDAISDMSAATVQLRYNSAVIGLPAIQSFIGQYGFEIPPMLAQAISQVGSQIVIPPNGNS